MKMLLFSHLIYNQRHSSGHLLLSVLYLLCYTGGNCLTVTTSVGGDAVLPCQDEPATDHTDTTVEWSRVDLPRDQYVYFHKNGQEFKDTKNPSYDGRTSLFMGEVKKGNVSLKLSGVNSSDEGTYTCFLPDCQKEFTVRLIVEEHHSNSGSTEGREGELTLLLGNNTDVVSEQELPTDGQFPWWMGIFISTVILLIGVASLLLWKVRCHDKQNYLYVVKPLKFFCCETSTLI